MFSMCYTGRRFSEAYASRRNWPGELQQAFADLAGGSAVMNDVRSLMAQVAGRDVSVLINGESGTGKEVVANCLHKASCTGCRALCAA